MKTTKIIYWTSTPILALLMVLSAFMYLSAPQIKEGFHHLGFPDYLRVELGIAKFIAGVFLLLPVWRWVKEWTYAGLAITFASAFIAHLTSGDPLSAQLMPLVMGVVLAVSYVAFHKLQPRITTARS